MATVADQMIPQRRNSIIHTHIRTRLCLPRNYYMYKHTCINEGATKVPSLKRYMHKYVYMYVVHVHAHVCVHVCSACTCTSMCTCMYIVHVHAHVCVHYVVRVHAQVHCVCVHARSTCTCTCMVFKSQYTCMSVRSCATEIS